MEDLTLGYDENGDLVVIDDTGHDVESGEYVGEVDE